MTTIAYRDGIMAADMRVINDGWIVSETTSKLRRLGDGSIAGFAMNAAFWMERWVAWYDSAKSPDALDGPDMKDECWVLHAQKGGILMLWSGQGIQNLSHEQFRAIGSGHPAARAALLTGASAELAVQIASQIDPFTGPAVEIMTL